MVETLGGMLLNYVKGRGKEQLSSVIEELKLWNFLKKLEATAQSTAMRFVVDTEYYHQLDAFILTNNLIEYLIYICYDKKRQSTPTAKEFADEHLEQFLIKFPQFRQPYKTELHGIFVGLYKTVDSAIHQLGLDEKTRHVDNTVVASAAEVKEVFTAGTKAQTDIILAAVQKGEKSTPNHIPIHLKSYDIQFDCEATCDLCSLALRRDINWDEELKPVFVDFLRQLQYGKVYNLHFNSHLCFAFGFGLVASKTQTTIKPIHNWPESIENQRTKEALGLKCVPLTYRKEIGTDLAVEDAAIAIGITRDILGDVRDYLVEENIPVSIIHNFVLAEGLVESENHSQQLVNQIKRAMQERKSTEKRAKLHLFAAAPALLMYQFGSHAEMLRDVTVYELNKTDFTYYPAYSLGTS